MKSYSPPRIRATGNWRSNKMPPRLSPGLVPLINQCLADKLPADQARQRFTAAGYLSDDVARAEAIYRTWQIIGGIK